MTFDDISAERAEQDRKFPGQRLPYIHEGAFPGRVNLADALRYVRRANDDDGAPSWSWVLLEEVYEAIEAALEGRVVDMREELVQVAAVAVRIVEQIDAEPKVHPEIGDYISARLGVDDLVRSRGYVVTEPRVDSGAWLIATPDGYEVSDFHFSSTQELVAAVTNARTLSVTPRFIAVDPSASWRHEPQQD